MTSKRRIHRFLQIAEQVSPQTERPWTVLEVVYDMDNVAMSSGPSTKIVAGPFVERQEALDFVTLYANKRQR